MPQTRVVGVKYGQWGREKYGISPTKVDTMEVHAPSCLDACDILQASTRVLTMVRQVIEVHINAPGPFKIMCEGRLPSPVMGGGSSFGIPAEV